MAGEALWDRNGPWTLYVCPSWTGSFPHVEAAATLIRACTDRIHSNSRNEIYRVRTDGAILMVKRSKRQERRWWVQLTSGYRGGDGFRGLRALEHMWAAGIPAPEPVFSLERTTEFRVVESWMAYRFLEGSPATGADLPAVAGILSRLHAAGWVHGDAHLANFLVESGRVRLLDCATLRPRRFPFSRMHDIAFLESRHPGIRALFGLTGREPAYRLAVLQRRGLVGWRRFKKFVRTEGRRPESKVLVGLKTGRGRIT